jgi:peroxiredoxin
VTTPPVTGTRLVAGRIGATALALYLCAVAVRIDGCYGPEPQVRDGAPRAGPAVGAAFPAFTLRDVGGATVGLADLAGTPAVLVLVPSLDWSAPTKARVLDLADALQGRSDVKGAVVMTAEQATTRSLTFVRDHDTPLFYLVDDGGLVARLGLATTAPDGTATTLPATFVLDGKGVVRLRDVRKRPEGWPSAATILDVLAPLR